jgi:hypothetical protein
MENRLKGLIPRALFLGEMRELFRLFLLNCDYSNKLFLLDCSQFKRNRRNISHFAEKKRPWNQALRSGVLFTLREHSAKKSWVFSHMRKVDSVDCVAKYWECDVADTNRRTAIFDRK